MIAATAYITTTAPATTIDQLDMGTLIVLGIVLVFIGVTIYALVTDNKPASDESLLDFLDQTGYSVVRLATGWVAITDGANKIVGKPAQDIREAIMSAVDGVVAGEVLK